MVRQLPDTDALQYDIRNTDALVQTPEETVPLPSAALVRSLREAEELIYALWRAVCDYGWASHTLPVPVGRALRNAHASLLSSQLTTRAHRLTVLIEAIAKTRLITEDLRIRDLVAKTRRFLFILEVG
jgi:hypothetical protein